MRLFVAIRLTRGVKDYLGGYISAIRAVSPHSVFTAPDNLHITLAFIGEQKNAASVCAALDGVIRASFDMNIGGMDSFGELCYAKAEGNGLDGLAKDVRASLERAGIPFDTKPFKPHITLARQTRIKNAVELPQGSASMRVSEFSLMLSEWKNGRLVYTELYRKRLKPL